MSVNSGLCLADLVVAYHLIEQWGGWAGIPPVVLEEIEKPIVALGGQDWWAHATGIVAAAAAIRAARQRVKACKDESL